MANFLKILAKTMAVGFVFVAVYFTLFVKKDFNRDAQDINPKIYYAFQEIYHLCRAGDISTRTRDCRIVVDVFNRCMRGALNCPVSEYYQFMKNLGYDLPPFYMDE